MKKKLIALALAWTLAIVSMTGCGNTEAPAGTDGSASVPENTDASSEESTPSTDAEASSEETDSSETESGTSSEASESTESSEAESESSEEEATSSDEEEITPVTDEWAVNLYNALLEDDYETVMGILVDASTVKEMCAPYEYTEWAMWDYETAYKMTMSDGQVMGIIVYEHEDNQWEISSFVSYGNSDGFDSTGYGDHCVLMHPDGTYAYIKDGNEVISTIPDQTGFTMEEGGIWTVWHM